MCGVASLVADARGADARVRAKEFGHLQTQPDAEAMLSMLVALFAEVGGEGAQVTQDGAAARSGGSGGGSSSRFAWVRPEDVPASPSRSSLSFRESLVHEDHLTKVLQDQLTGVCRLDALPRVAAERRPPSARAHAPSPPVSARPAMQTQGARPCAESPAHFLPQDSMSLSTAASCTMAQAAMAGTCTRDGSSSPRPRVRRTTWAGTALRTRSCTPTSTGCPQPCETACARKRCAADPHRGNPPTPCCCFQPRSRLPLLDRHERQWRRLRVRRATDSACVPSFAAATPRPRVVGPMRRHRGLPTPPCVHGIGYLLSPRGPGATRRSRSDACSWSTCASDACSCAHAGAFTSGLDLWRILPPPHSLPRAGQHRQCLQAALAMQKGARERRTKRM